jgi:hypothetical protein
MTLSKEIDECPICRRRKDVELAFCGLHSTAFKNLNENYERWRLAFGYALAREEYNEILRKLPETGNAIKQVIEYVRADKLGKA